MKVLLTGASGFVGRHLLRALEAAGHSVKPISRRHGTDMAQMLKASDWLPHLAGVDAAVNSVGIIGERGSQRFEPLHTAAPLALFEACQQAGVKRVVQISALGADETAFSAYHLSKRAADAGLCTSGLDWFVLRPSLVYGPGGSSTVMFKRMASLPLIPLVGDGRQRVQPVHISDVVATVLRALQAKPAQQTLDVAGPAVFTMGEWLQLLRQSTGRGKGLALPSPFPLVLASAYVLRYINPMLHPDNLRMLQAGNTASEQALAKLTQFLGRAPLAATVELVNSSQAPGSAASQARARS